MNAIYYVPGQPVQVLALKTPSKIETLFACGPTDAVEVIARVPGIGTFFGLALPPTLWRDGLGLVGPGPCFNPRLCRNEAATLTAAYLTEKHCELIGPILIVFEPYDNKTSDPNYQGAFTDAVQVIEWHPDHLRLLVTGEVECSEAEELSHIDWTSFFQKPTSEQP